MRTKKVQKSRHVSDMRDPSVMSLVFYVGNAVGKGADGHVSDMRAANSVGDVVGIGVGKAVGNPSVNVAKSRNFFATLCEIPTGYSPSVYTSVKR